MGLSKGGTVYVMILLVVLESTAKLDHLACMVCHELSIMQCILSLMLCDAVWKYDL